METLSVLFKFFCRLPCQRSVFYFSWLRAHRLILSFELETENIGEGCSQLLLPPHGRGEACKWVGAPLKTSTFLVFRKLGRGITSLFSASPWPGIWVGAGNTLASVRFWFVGCSGSWHRGPIWVCRGEACKGWVHPSKLERFVVWERGGGISPPFSASPRPGGLSGGREHSGLSSVMVHCLFRLLGTGPPKPDVAVEWLRLAAAGSYGVALWPTAGDNVGLAMF